MARDLSGIVQFRDANGSVGTGFLLPGGRIATCAHVVNAVLGRGTHEPSEPSEGEIVHVLFLASNTPKATRRARVFFWRPLPRERGPDGSVDIALLELEEPPPPECRPAYIGTYDKPERHKNLAAFGFPEGYPTGSHAQGTFNGVDIAGWLEIRWDVAGQTPFRTGHSGAPLFMEDGSAVVGMVAAVDSGSHIAQAVPAALLAATVPELKTPSEDIRQRNPYRGLEVFRAQHCRQFFGRDRVIGEVRDKLEKHRFVWIIGGSGSGKSSLALAGVLPAAGNDGWLTAEVRPRSDPVASLADSLLKFLEPSKASEPGPARRAVERYANEWHADPQDLVKDLEAITAYSEVPGLLLLIDQFEELFTEPNAERRRTFVTCLEALWGRVNQKLRILATLRTDFLDDVINEGPLKEMIRDADVKLGAMTAIELRQVIEEPARCEGVQFARGLVERLVADAFGEGAPPNDPSSAKRRVGQEARYRRAGRLPLLEFALKELWDRQQAGEISHAAYDDPVAGIGKIDGALARHAETTFETLTDDDKKRTQLLMRRLVRLERGGQDVRRVVPKDEVVDDWPLVAKLASAHLVMTDEDARGTATVEVVHEALLRGWPALKDWIWENREFDTWRERLSDSANQWKSAPSKPEKQDLLLRGTQLQKALGYSGERKGDLRPFEIQFIEESRRETDAAVEAERSRLKADLARSRRQRAVASGLLIAATLSLVVSLSFGVRIFYDLEQSRNAARRQWLLTADLQIQQGFARAGIGYALRAFLPGAIDLEERINHSALVTLHQAMSQPYEVTPPMEHENAIYAAVFDASGTRIVTASRDHTARVWNAKTGAPLTLPMEHKSAVYSAAFDASGTRVVTTSDDHTARVWDAKTGAPLTPPMEHKDAVTSAAFDASGTRVVTASNDHTARVWDAKTGAPLTPPMEHKNAVHSAAFDASGTRVVTASNDHTARVWDAKTGAPLTPPMEHKDAVSSAAFDASGTRIVTASDDHTARVWDAKTGAPLTPPIVHKDAVHSAAFDAGGTRILTVSNDHTARVWDAKTGAPLTPPMVHKDALHSAAFDASGTRVVTASDDHTARVWDAKTGAPLTPPMEHKYAVYSAAFDASGTWVVTASGDTARVWDAKTGAPLTPPMVHKDAVHSAAFDASGTRVVTASDDHTARVWDAKTGAPLTPPMMHNDAVHSAAFDASGMRVVTASDDDTARVWDAKTGTPLTPPMVHKDKARSAAFDASGTRVVTASDDHTARVWDAKTGTPLTPPMVHDGGLFSAAFDAGGTNIVTASDHTARVWDAKTGAPLTPPMEHDGLVLCAAFDASGTRVVTASTDHTARVWDVKTGAPLTSPMEQNDALYSAAFDGSGTRIVTASQDGTARVWALPPYGVTLVQLARSLVPDAGTMESSNEDFIQWVEHKIMGSSR
jgi:WD40 repeat protein/energy-coupling factor transporter ATP-binding protein EcfA2